ncbi:hypothetical protein AB1Y20_001488 [Prymnesium parvum]|uniref:Plastidal glycolate/glycerate translocator 1, chloroplastic n=1 Tax=Prymnesium parvum TaxID=97485 RepID=A0AB34KBF0_PRYPA
MLGGFALLCLGHAAAPAATAALDAFYAPACRLLSTWLAAIFAPAFVTLPLTMPSLAAAQLALFVGLCAAGLASSTATNALLYALFRRVGGSGRAPAEPPPAAAARSRSSPFPRSERACLAAAALASAAAHFLCGTPLALDVALLSSSLLAFSVASTFPPRFNLVVHPFLTTSAVTMGLCAGLALVTSQSWHAVLSRYRSGAGAWLLSLMGPTVISFAFQLFAYRKQLAANAVQIVGVGVGGAMCGMMTAAAAARALGLPHVLRVALLSRSTTTALAGDVARLSSIEPGLGMLAAFATGLFGIWFGKPLLRLLRIEDPAARGLSLSAAAHGGALLTLIDEPEAFPYAALMLNLGGACTVGLLSVRPIRAFLLSVALGMPA